MKRTDVRTKLLIFFFPIVLSFPFLNRAYFVDDSYFVQIAEWLVDHPERPYDFRTDDAGLQNPGWEKNGFVRMVNPLAHHYFLAGLLKIGGNRVWFLRLGCVLLSGFAGLFLFGLARRFMDYPVWATLLVLATPVFWLTSHSLLIDSTLSFFFLAALYCFIRAGERDSVGLMGLSGVLMGLGILTKYPGLLILPLTACWWILKFKTRGRKWTPLLAWAIALAFLFAYSAWTNALYGQPHIVAASKRMVRVFGWDKPFILFVFLSGVTLLPAVYWALIGKARAAAGLAGMVCLVLFFASPFGGFSAVQSVLLAFWFTTSLVFIWGVWVLRDRWVYPKDHFLFLWFFGFLAMMILVMGWVAARYYMIVAPAVAFLSVRGLEVSKRIRTENVLKSALAVLIVAGACLAYADYRQADPSRNVGDVLDQEWAGDSGRRFYLGDSFTMSYLKDHGWTPAFPGEKFEKGDLILSKDVTMPPIWAWWRDVAVERVAIYEYPTRFPIKVMDKAGSAGFYASAWGALPFTLSRSPWERFELYRVKGDRR